ncbi:helix-turn-helix domain-containing protein [Pseudonocardia sp. TRM90224]|uniref:AraC-like ligand-binding domain-containing protein n=1 Tax=Pseudonocardia sp. TRM90224 TaxID=2812678 RepID=UPI001E5B59B3|nr:helix-turn-helix domain-containing protein [Pseudonocardia sp. TRM90224]
MPLLVDTSTVPAPDRFDYWAGAHDRVLHPLRLDRPGRDPFTGRIQAHRVGAVTVFRIEGDASAIERTARLVAQQDPEELQVTHLVRGRFRIEQGGRTAFVGAGDLAGYETSHPYRVESAGPFELLLFTLPRTLLGARADAICARTASTLDGRSGTVAIAGSFLRNLADRIEDGSLDANAAGLGDCVADMVRMVFSADRSSTANIDRPVDALFTQVTAYVDVHIADPALTPRSLAAAHFVSPRLLHRTFAERGHTVAGWIRTRRLDTVARDLSDPALAARSIRAVAASRGFTDTPHFNRLFRQVHGCTPGEYRAGLSAPR